PQVRISRNFFRVVFSFLSATAASGFSVLRTPTLPWQLRRWVRSLNNLGVPLSLNCALPERAMTISRVCLRLLCETNCCGEMFSGVVEIRSSSRQRESDFCAPSTSMQIHYVD